MKEVKKPDSILNLGSIDISALKSMTSCFSEKVWQLENERKENNFLCFHHTQHIVFRFIKHKNDPDSFYSNPIWSVWKEVLLPIMDQVVMPYGYSQPRYPKVMLARLNAGYHIDPHIDKADSNSYTHKIHIPIQTNKKAFFTSNGVKQHLETNHAYEVNNIVHHAAENKGDMDRVHFIFEVFDAATLSRDTIKINDI